MLQNTNVIISSSLQGPSVQVLHGWLKIHITSINSVIWKTM